MKIAFDTSPLGSGHATRGIGVHTNELVGAIKRECQNKAGLEFEAFDFKADSQRLKSGGYGLIHYTSFNPYRFSLPFQKLAPKVVLTIHDLIPLIYPDNYPPGVKGKIRFVVQKILMAGVNRVITISETSKKDICRFLPFAPEQVEVVYLAPRPVFKQVKIEGEKLKIKKKYHLPDRFILYVGDVNYNKNLLSLCWACKQVKVPLVMVGKNAVKKEIDLTHPENRPFAELLGRYGQDPDIHRIGYVPDDDLVAVWNLALAYCFPSYYEGFGFSLLESMACGVSVVASKIQVHTEIAGRAAFWVDPKKPEQIADGIKEVISNQALRERLISEGLKQVANYSWTKTARETLRVYDALLEKE